MIHTKFIPRISFIFALLLSFTSHSQFKLSTKEANQEWNLLKDQDGIKLYTREQDCKVGPLEKPLSYLLVKIENSNKNEKDVYFQIGLHFEESCEGCDNNPESERAINVSSNSVIQCDCSFERGELSYLINNTNSADFRLLTSIELINFKVD